MRATNTSRKIGSFRAVAVACAALIALGELAGSGPMFLGGGSAEAIVGRPFTPLSFAGVARRTTRRQMAYGGGYGGAYGGGGYYGGGIYNGGALAALPGGCGGLVGGVYRCGGATYAPQYSGTTVVYVQQ